MSTDPENKDDEIQIVEVDDAGAPEGGAEATASTTAADAPSREDTVESLRIQLAAAKTASTISDQRAEAATREAVQFRTEAETQRYAAISRALDAQAGVLEKAEGIYAAAMESGDYKAAAKAQTEIAKAVNAQQQLEGGKSQMDAMRADPRYQQPQRQAEPTFEQRISTMSTPTQAWLRSHPDAITDPTRQNRVMSAHHAAMADGIAPDSKEYFDFIEQNSGYKKAAEAQTTRQASPSTPVNGQARQPAGKQVNGNQFYMSPKMREAAKTSGVSNIEYAKQVQKGVANGEDWAIELTRTH
jgi:hypothetical protein